MRNQAMCEPIQEQTKQQETLAHVIPILLITRFAAQVNRQKLNEIIDAVQRSNEDLNKLFYITEVLTQCIRYQQMYIYMCTILAYLKRLPHLYEASCHAHDGLCGCSYNQYIVPDILPCGRPETYA